jgi:hypothetical protein
MRVPVQAPALTRNHRGGPARPFGGGRTDTYGVYPSQYEGGDDSEGAEDDGGESGDEGGNEGESSVESD